MMDGDVRRFLVRHGTIVVLIGSLAGLGYTLVVTGDLHGSRRAWHLAHLQPLMIGTLILAVSSFVEGLRLGERAKRVLAACFVITGYCYAFGPIWGAALGVRGLEPVLPPGNLVMFISNAVASLSVLVGLGLAAYGTRKPAQGEGGRGGVPG